MSDSSSSFPFDPLFEIALRDYEQQTGMKLGEHPLAKELEICNFVDRITAILQEKAQPFREFRGDDGKLMKSLNSTVHVLYTVTTSTALGEGIGLLFPPAKAIFAGIAILLAVVKDVSASYDSLIELFESMENLLTRLNIYTRIPPTAAMTDIVVKIMVEFLSTLAVATKQVKQGQLKKFAKKILGENEIESALRRLDRLTLDEARTTASQTLEVVYRLVQDLRVVMDDGKARTESVQGTLGRLGWKQQAGTTFNWAIESMHEIISKMNKSERDKLRKDLREWLSPPDPWVNHNITQKYRYEGTGSWWTQGDTFAKWKSSGLSSLLWIHGKPGSGKSILCSSIVEDIYEMGASNLAALAFFYFDFRNDQKKDMRGLVSSLLVQLCYQSDAYFAILCDFYLGHDGGSKHPSDIELVRCLKTILELPKLPTVYIVIDALDECPKNNGFPSSRDEVLNFLAGLVGLNDPNLRICVTSRPEADIKSLLDPLTFKSMSISLHDEDGQIRDIYGYITAIVNTDPKMRRWKPADKILVIDALSKKAGGMFRWAVCQLEYLRPCIPGRIRGALDELPATLDETYARMLEDISDQNWEYAHRLFQCVAVAARPLRVEGLAEFLALDFSGASIPTFRVDWRSEEPAYTILSMCSSLLAIVDVDGSPVIQFSHFSVKEYLTSERLANAKPTISRYHVSTSLAHMTVAQACLGVLLHLDENTTKDDLEKFPLAEYAAEHWVGHTQFANVPPKTRDGIRRLFDPRKHHLPIWIWIYDPVYPWRRPVRSKFPPKIGATPLHYAAFCGIDDIVEFLVVDCSQDVNAPGFDRNETPLATASRKGHSEVARILLKHHANPEIRDKADWNPLGRASREGHAAVARTLLHHRADANARDYYNNTALHVASTFGQLEVVWALLEYGADVNANDRNNRTPLHMAWIEGASRAFLECGADANAKDDCSRAPLHVASERGYVQVVRALLEHNANPDAQDNSNRSPLHLASEGGYMEVTRLLLDYSANSNAQDSSNQTPLHVALDRGYVEVAGILLEHGADINGHDNNGQTPLHVISEQGNVQVVRTLLENGAEAKAQDGNGRTPLHIAAKRGFVTLARILLDYGADKNARNAKMVTPLHFASQAGYPDLVRLLLRSGSDVHARNDKGETPFQNASSAGHDDIIQILSEYGAAD